MPWRSVPYIRRCSPCKGTGKVMAWQPGQKGEAPTTCPHCQGEKQVTDYRLQWMPETSEEIRNRRK